MARARSNRIADLGELQLAVLDLLGQIEEGTVYDVLDEFPEAQRPRYTTVLTVLRSLERRGLVTHVTRDRAHVFCPTARAGQVRRELLTDVIERVFGGSPRALVATLLDVEDMTPEVLDEMKTLIAQTEAEDDGQ